MKQSLLSLLIMLLPLMAHADAVEINGIYYNLITKVKTAEVTQNPNKYTGNVIIPSSVVYNDVTYSVTSIGDDAFNGSTLTSVTMPNSVTSIGNSAFRDCSGLTSVAIPNSVKSIGNYAFQNCIALTSATIPNTVTSIGEYAFRYCSGLTTITIPNSVTSIGNGAFESCSGLTSVTIPNSVTSIRANAFWNCSGLKSVTIPNSVTSIENYAFSGCSDLTSITIPNSVTSIGNYGFSGCSSLTNITIGSGISNIGSYEGYSFANCPELTDFYCYAEHVPSTGSSVFEGSYIEFATLHVPASAVNAYKNTAPWNKFKEIVGMGKQYYTLTYMVDGTKYMEYSVGEGDNITPEPAPTKQGYTFSGWSTIPVTMPANDVTVTGTFTKNTYKLTYMVDGETYKTISYQYGAAITPEPAPTKQGYTFSGWSAIPAAMPANDVTVTGTFIKNAATTYTLTYMVDGQVYKTFYYEAGATVERVEAPTKEGFTFSGWSNTLLTMPERNVTITGTFTKNAPTTYKLTYLIDGKVYKTSDYAAGATIIAEPAPTKEGYTFSGWSTIPATMPAYDVTINGSFNKTASYTLTYMVNGEVYKTVSYEYGEKITPEPEPTKEGATFSGWSWIPSKMPDEDVVVTGTFDMEKYKLTYKVDGADYKILEVEVGSAITPEPEPTKDGYTFSGWSWIPKKMPDEDVTITGTFTPSTGVETAVGSGRPFDVYTVTGRKVRSQVTSLKGLKKGVYIVEGKKVVVK